jgi:hypothetical protein
MARPRDATKEFRQRHSRATSYTTQGFGPVYSLCSFWWLELTNKESFGKGAVGYLTCIRLVYLHVVPGTHVNTGQIVH